MIGESSEDHRSSTPGHAGLDFFYDVDNYGYLCGLQLFGQPVSFTSDDDCRADGSIL